MTRSHGPLLRRLRLLLACLVLVMASVPPWTVAARDTSAVSVRAPAARASSSGFKAASTSHHCASRLDEAFELEISSTPGLAATVQELDRRYLYLELVTLLS